MYKWIQQFGPVLAFAAFVITLGGAPAQLPFAGRKPHKSPRRGNEAIQTFPSTGPMQTAWKVRWRTERGPGLIIMDAFFKKGPNEPWIQVLGEARLAESFVPYHPGSPRFWDVSYNFPLCRVTKADSPLGQLLAASPGKAPTVVRELRDQGLAYKDAAGVRRGEEMVLWGTLSAANYRYVIEYTFRDDGLIRFRCGATGHNYSGNEWTPHMHNHYWRIDVNLGEPEHNRVELCIHREPDPNGKKSQAVTDHVPFNNNREGFADFNPKEFTMLRIINTKHKNIRGEPWTYDLVPYRMGNSRHYGSPREQCTHHDFWVTKNRKGEIYYPRVHQYVKDQESILDTDVVIWYGDPGHHEPRSEDGEIRRIRGGQRRFRGATPIMWTTFELRPRDFWNRTPFFPYKN